MLNKKIAIIGCGNLGQSILKGLVYEKKFPGINVYATKRNTDSLKRFEEYGIKITKDNIEAIRQSEIIILALKPHNIIDFLNEFKSAFDARKHLLISLATGITIKEINDVLTDDIKVVRAMPNTSVDVTESVTCICTKNTLDEDVNWVKSFFDLLGTTIIINEDLMEASTVLGACGIAYVMRFMRAMVQGGIQIGFDAKTASQIVNQTVKGASQLLIERREHPEFEIDKVTTPKGCTIAGLNEMEHNGFSSALIKGIVASFQKIEHLEN